MVFLHSTSNQILDCISQGQVQHISFETTGHRNHSIDWVDTNGNHVDRDDQSGDNVALLTLGRALFNLEQLVNTLYQLEHNAAENGEELRK